MIILFIYLALLIPAMRVAYIVSDKTITDIRKNSIKRLKNTPCPKGISHATYSRPPKNTNAYDCSGCRNDVSLYGVVYKNLAVTDYSEHIEAIALVCGFLWPVATVLFLLSFPLKKTVEFIFAPTRRQTKEHSIEDLNAKITKLEEELLDVHQ